MNKILFVVGLLSMSAAAVYSGIAVQDEGIIFAAKATGGIKCNGDGIVCDVANNQARITVAGGVGPLAGVLATGTLLADGGTTMVQYDSYNVTSVTRTGAGRYEVLMNADAGDTSYNIQLTSLTGDIMMRASITDGSLFGVDCDALPDDGGVTPEGADCTFSAVVWDFQ